MPTDAFFWISLQTFFPVKFLSFSDNLNTKFLFDLSAEHRKQAIYLAKVDKPNMFGIFEFK